MKTRINEMLAADHSELDELLAEIFTAFENENVEQIYTSLDIFWARLAMHIRAEHLHLFPAILFALESAQESEEKSVPSSEKAKSAVERLKDDHNFFMRELSAAIKQMRDLLGNDRTDKSSRLKKARETIIPVKNRLETHNESEEAEVYRWADALLSASERARLNEKMEKEISNLPPRFKPNE